MKTSLIIPVYNVRNCLNECLKSVLRQAVDDLEVILVDDGSTDGSGAFCDVWAADKPFVTVIHQTNGGLSAARNTGLDHATGDLIAFLDSDDRLGEGTLRDNLRYFADCPTLDLVEFPVREHEGSPSEHLLTFDPRWVNANYAPHTASTHSSNSTHSTHSTHSSNSSNSTHKSNSSNSTHKSHSSHPATVPGAFTPGTISRHLAPVFCDWIRHEGYTHCYVWNKVYRATLWQRHRFPVGQVFEDTAVMPDILLECRTVFYSAKGCYHYISRPGSISRTWRYADCRQLFLNQRAIYNKASTMPSLKHSLRPLRRSMLYRLIDMGRCKDCNKADHNRLLASFKPFERLQCRLKLLTLPPLVP